MGSLCPIKLAPEAAAVRLSNYVLVVAQFEDLVCNLVIVDNDQVPNHRRPGILIDQLTQNLLKRFGLLEEGLCKFVQDIVLRALIVQSQKVKDLDFPGAQFQQEAHCPIKVFVIVSNQIAVQTLIVDMQF